VTNSDVGFLFSY